MLKRYGKMTDLDTTAFKECITYSSPKKGARQSMQDHMKKHQGQETEGTRIKCEQNLYFLFFFPSLFLLG